MWRKLAPFFLIIVAITEICAAFSSANDFNPYKTLGLLNGDGATQIEIKRAYKRLVMEWHPDRNKRPEAEQRFLEVNRAYKILSNADRREAYDKFGFMDDGDWLGQSFQGEKQHFQYVHWPPPPRKQQIELKTFILPFASVLGTLFFIFLIGFLLNQLNASEDNERRRQSGNEESNVFKNNQAKTSKNQEPEEQKVPLTEEEKQQRKQARIWRTMGPLFHELRAETQFGLIRLLKPGCRSIILLVDKEDKDTLLQQFARHTYCLRNNKTFSFGFLVVPKNLNWFRSLLELTLPAEKELKEDSASLSTATTDTGEKDKEVNEPEEKAAPSLGQFSSGEEERKMTARKRLKNINPKHTVGTVLVICGWKLYFSIYHPMHRPSSLRTRTVQLESLGDEEFEEEVEDSYGEKGAGATKHLVQRKRSFVRREALTEGPLNVENVLNGFPTFLERLLEGSVRRYYIPEWPDNFT